MISKIKWEILAVKLGERLNIFSINDKTSFESSFERAIELFDLTIADERWQGEKRKEVIRSKEKFVIFITDTSSDNKKVFEELEKLDEYFLVYGILANEKRLKNRIP